MKIGLADSGLQHAARAGAAGYRAGHGGADRRRRRVRVHRGHGPLLPDPGAVGPAEKEMLEGYTTLGYLAACTSRAALVTLVTGTIYREPGILAKIVTTLDVLSDGRAWLGIGAALERGGVARPRHPVPAGRRAVRAARGDAADLPADVARRREAVPGQALPARAAAELAAVAVPAAPADHDRRRRREEDAAAGGPVRRRVQPVRRPGRGPQAGRAAPALRGGRPRLRHDLQDGLLRRSTRPAAPSGSSTSSARSPGSASTRRSARWRTCGT